MNLRPLLLALPLLLAGCDLESLLADPRVAQREADAKAIGSACRHGLRSIEDCYALNEKASKAAIFAGWKEMDQYMRDNKIEGIVPTGIKPPSSAPATVTDPKDGSSQDSETPAPKSKNKSNKTGG